MNVKKELRDTIVYILIGILVANIINFGLGHALNTEKPLMAVVSDSMVPTLNKGDIVVVKGVPASDIKVGDIIVYYNPYRNIDVVHRVVGIEIVDGKKYFITKGDNNPYADQDPRARIAPPVSEEMLKGKVVLVIPKIGLIKVWFVEVVKFLKETFF